MGFLFLLSAVFLGIVARLFFPHKINFGLVLISILLITGYYLIPYEYQVTIDKEINKISFIKG